MALIEQLASAALVRISRDMHSGLQPFPVFDQLAGDVRKHHADGLPEHHLACALNMDVQTMRRMCIGDVASARAYHEAQQGGTADRAADHTAMMTDLGEA